MIDRLQHDPVLVVSLVSAFVAIFMAWLITNDRRRENALLAKFPPDGLEKEMQGGFLPDLALVGYRRSNWLSLSTDIIFKNVKGSQIGKATICDLGQSIAFELDGRRFKVQQNKKIHLDSSLYEAGNQISRFQRKQWFGSKWAPTSYEVPGLGEIKVAASRSESSLRITHRDSEIGKLTDLNGIYSLGFKAQVPVEIRAFILTMEFLRFLRLPSLS